MEILEKHVEDQMILHIERKYKTAIKEYNNNNLITAKDKASELLHVISYLLDKKILCNTGSDHLKEIKYHTTLLKEKISSYKLNDKTAQNM